jgi:SAM-dependent methyltransferase
MEVLEAPFDGVRMIADEWNRKSPQNSHEIKKFYKETENYIFELACWHRSPQRKYLTKMAVDICSRSKLHTILDFGCGIGQDGISFAEAGFRVTLSDLPGKTFDFAKWRAEKRGLNINFVNSDELAEEYDAILCFDVLEHLLEPEQTVEYLYKHLKDYGILLVTVNFKHSEIHPLAYVSLDMEVEEIVHDLRFYDIDLFNWYFCISHNT